jgi:hypothetical protein
MKAGASGEFHLAKCNFLDKGSPENPALHVFPKVPLI